jgi:hypothetical protein
MGRSEKSVTIYIRAAAAWGAGCEREPAPAAEPAVRLPVKIIMLSEHCDFGSQGCRFEPCRVQDAGF